MITGIWPTMGTSRKWTYNGKFEDELIDLKVQSKFQPNWGDLTLPKNVVLTIIGHPNFMRKYPSFEPVYLGYIYAIKFPSGVIFDCLMAHDDNKEIRRACWR